MKNKLQLLLATIMTAAACSALAATSVESDVRIGSTPGNTSDDGKINSNTGPMTAPPPTTHKAEKWTKMSSVRSWSLSEIALKEDCLRVFPGNSLGLLHCGKGDFSRVGVVLVYDVNKGVISRHGKDPKYPNGKRYIPTGECLRAPDVLFAKSKNKVVNLGPCSKEASMASMSSLMGSPISPLMNWEVLHNGFIVLGRGGVATNGKSFRYIDAKLQKSTPHCLEYSSQLKRVTVEPCDAKNRAQIWRPYIENLKKG